MQKILYVTTVSATMGFFPEHIKMLQQEGHTVELACNLEQPLPERVAALRCPTHHLSFSRAPLASGNRAAYRELKALLEAGRYDLVHCHTPVAAAVTRLAGRRFRKQGLKIIYTAHGFHFYKGAPAKNWLLYYPVERLCARWTDVLITINREDYAFAQKKLKAGRIEYVPGVGIDLGKFQGAAAHPAERERLRAALGIPPGATLLLSVGELNENKNHEMVLRALQSVDENVYYCIAGTGPKRDALEEQRARLGLNGRVRLLGFRTDIGALCAAADVFVFPSFREGLSVSLLEAMASGLPCVVSDIRGNRDLIAEGAGGFLRAPGDAAGFASALRELAGNPILRARMGAHNAEAVRAFSQDAVLERMRAIYQDVQEGCH